MTSLCILTKHTYICMQMIQVFTNHLITLHLEHDLNLDLSIVNTWCIQNRLVINENKTNAMIICSFQKRRTLPHHNINVQINGINIANVDSDKILGVYLDNNLLMNVHIDHICTKLSRLLGLLYRIRGCLSIEAKILFYNSYVQPCFDYCVTTWGFCSNTHISRFSRLQKRFARVILNNYTSPSLNLFTRLNWLNVMERIEFSTSVLVFKCLNNLAPEILQSLFQPCGSLHNYLYAMLALILKFQSPELKLYENPLVIWVV